MSDRSSSDSKKNETAYTAFSSVDARVAKPVLGSDSAAAWQSFQSTNKTVFKKSSVAPTAPLKAADRAAGFTSWREERQNEERVRELAGEAAVNAGYTQFKAKDDDDDSKLTKKERQRIEKRLLGEDQDYFIPSKTWQGPKWDYVFTTKPHHGTGYYFDGMDSLKRLRNAEKKGNGRINADESKKRSSEEHSVTAAINLQADDQEPKKKKKKSKKGATAVTIVHDPTNPLQQVAEALQKKRQEQQQWQTAVDPSTNKTYYYNPLSGERSWDKPLPVGWQVATDATTGKEYYYNADTGVTAWERPS